MTTPTEPADPLEAARTRLEDYPDAGEQLDAALAAVRRYCGWHIFPERAETILVDGPGGDLLHVPSLRVVDVESVRERAGDAWSTVDVSWSAAGMLRKRSGCFTDEFRGIEVTLTHGFAEAPDVVKIVADVAFRELSNPHRRTALRVGERQESFGLTAGGGGGLFGTELGVLDQYRLNAAV